MADLPSDHSRRDRFEVGLHESKYVVMDRDALRLEDMVVAAYDARSAAQIDAEHRNLVAADDKLVDREEDR